MGTEPTEVDQETRFRLELAKRDIPKMLSWAAALVALLAIANWMSGRGTITTHLGEFWLTLLLATAAMGVEHPRLPASAAPQVWAAAMTVLVVALLLEVRTDPGSTGLAYALVVMTAFGPGTLAWRPFAIAAATMGTCAVVVAARWNGADSVAWTFTCVAGIAAGAALLRVRMLSVAETAQATAVTERFAVLDPLTGALNRHGLDLGLVRLHATAQRLLQPVCVAFIDIDGLKAANDHHGHEYGDEVIRSVADAVEASVRRGDLVARWGGDELVVIGLGDAPDVDDLTERIEAHIRACGIDLTKWSGHVSLGAAGGGPLDELDELIQRADADMYHRRAIRRGLVERGA